MIFEGLNCGYRTMTREFIDRMSRAELEEWLEFRGFAVYDDDNSGTLEKNEVKKFLKDLLIQK